MAIKSKTATETFYKPEWVDPKTGEPTSGWVFRRYKTGADDDAIQRHIVKTDVKMNAALSRRERRHAKPEVSTEIKASSARATMYVMSVRWFGPEFMIPSDFEDENGHSHPLAGQVPPLTLDWIGQHDGPFLEEVEDFLDDLYEGRSEEEQASFRGEPADLAEPEAEPAGATPAGS